MMSHHQIVQNRINFTNNEQILVNNVNTVFINTDDNNLQNVNQIQNGHSNVLFVTQDPQGKEILAIADQQRIANHTLDSYCS